MIVASFDIGIKNFAFCVEESKHETYNLPLCERYTDLGIPTNKMCSILENIYNNGNILLLEKYNLESSRCNQNVFVKLTAILDQYGDYWDKCNVILIEKQMQYKKKINPTALKIAQHTYSYFVFKYAKFKEILEYPAKNKTKVLGCGTDVKNIKKWAIEKALYICNKRNDTTSLDIINKNKKKDDYSDTIIQLQSYKVLKYLHT
jgi:hypothetical protein